MSMNQKDYEKATVKNLILCVALVFLVISFFSPSRRSSSPVTETSGPVEVTVEAPTKAVVPPVPPVTPLRAQAEMNEKDLSLLARFFLGGIRFYQQYMSPYIPGGCRYHPSCSVYGIQAIQKYGAIKGGWLTVKRIFRCAPWGGTGYDPVPEPDGVSPKTTETEKAAADSKIKIEKDAKAVKKNTASGKK